VSGQLHDPAASPPEEELPEHIVKEAGWTPVAVMKKRKIPHPCHEPNPGSSAIRHVAWSLYLLSYLGFSSATMHSEENPFLTSLYFR
jgi:hypothetical protein